MGDSNNSEPRVSLRAASGSNDIDVNQVHSAVVLPWILPWVAADDLVRVGCVCRSWRKAAMNTRELRVESARAAVRWVAVLQAVPPTQIPNTAKTERNTSSDEVAQASQSDSDSFSEVASFKGGRPEVVPVAVVRRLERLHCRTCLLTTVPPLHACWEGLVLLDLSDNKIASLALDAGMPALGRLTSLRWLSLRRNSLRTASVTTQPDPTPSCALDTGEALGGKASGTEGTNGGIHDAVAAPVVKVSGFWGLTSLQELDLSSNEIRDGLATAFAPDHLGSLSRLQTLNICGVARKNRLGATPPADLWRLEALTALNLNYNAIETLPEAISRLINLVSLEVVGNRLQTLPEGLGTLDCLERLAASKNRLEVVNDSGLPRGLRRMYFR